MDGREGVGVFWNESEHARRLALVLSRRVRCIYSIRWELCVTQARAALV